MLKFLITVLPAIAALSPVAANAGTKTSLPDSGELEAYADRWMEENLAARHIPGAVVVIVKDGRTLFSKGYGVADISTRRPMDPEKTGLRVASISKLFTATAVMQLHERGMAGLHEDVRSVFDTGILREYYAPVTLHQLLTHTAGVGDKFTGQTVAEPQELLPLGKYLYDEMTPPLAPPGFIINYTSLGIAAAAHVVEKTTGQTFEDYARENIFGPLGMERSSFIPSPGIMAATATGYKHIQGHDRVIEFRHWKPYPASSLVTTGGDMGRFMLAHLENGRIDDRNGNTHPLFSENTARMMHRRQFTMHPRMPGMAYGFQERMDNGQRILWHSGHMPGHRSGLYLLPGHRLGVFINSNSETKLYTRFFEDFMDRYFPVVSNEAPKMFRGGKPASHYAGAYRHTWYPRHTFGKIAAFHGIQGEQLNVSSAEDGHSLKINGETHVPIGPNLFRHAKRGWTTSFWETPDGRVLYLYRGGTRTYHKLRWYERLMFHRILLGAAFVSLLFSFCASLVHWRKRSRDSISPIPPALRITRVCAGWLSGLLLLFTAGMISLAAAGVYKMTQEIRWPLLALLAIPPIACAVYVALIPGFVTSWKEPLLSKAEKLNYSVLILSGTAVIWFLHYWNLLGYRF